MTHKGYHCPSVTLPVNDALSALREVLKRNGDGYRLAGISQSSKSPDQVTLFFEREFEIPGPKP